MREAQSTEPASAAKLAAMLDEVIQALDDAGHQSAACHVDLARNQVLSERIGAGLDRVGRSRVAKP